MRKDILCHLATKVLGRTNGVRLKRHLGGLSDCEDWEYRLNAYTVIANAMIKEDTEGSDVGLYKEVFPFVSRKAGPAPFFRYPSNDCVKWFLGEMNSDITRFEKIAFSSGNINKDILSSYSSALVQMVILSFCIMNRTHENQFAYPFMKKGVSAFWDLNEIHQSKYMEEFSPAMEGFRRVVKGVDERRVHLA